MIALPEALRPLADYRQFILWITTERAGKRVKLPVDHRTVKVTDAHNPDIWMDAERAIQTAKLYGLEYGVGFVFTKDDPFFFVDIDKCLETDNETWSPVAHDLINRLSGAAIEVSQSGRGLHIIGKGVTPNHSCKNIPLGLELYTERRFVALTGTNAMGSADIDCSLDLPELVNTYFPPNAAVINPTTWTIDPVAEWSGPTNDDKLIAKAKASKSAASAFNAKARFVDLWNRNIDVLSNMYAPDASDKGEFDESQTDAALAQHLAFWTGNDCDRMLRLMNMSGLVREKWIRHKSYLRNTITRAVSLQKNVYSGGKKQKFGLLARHDIAETEQGEHIQFIDYETSPESGLTNDDITNAIILLSSVFKNRLRKAAGQFYWWTGKYYEPVEDASVRCQCGLAIMGSITATQNKVKSLVEAMRDHAQIIPELDPPSRNVFWRNGVLSLDTFELYSHHLNNNNSRTLTVDYDPMAQAPQWLEWLSKDVFPGDFRHQSLLQEFIGWILCSSNLGIEKACLFIGPPRAGKGVIARLIFELLGRAAASFSLSELDDHKRLSALRMANVGIDSDAVGATSRNARAVMGLFKLITSNDRLTIPQLYKQSPWEGALNCKLLILANSVPSMWDDSAATANRWVPVVFKHSYLGKEDPNLYNRLSMELPGIAVWAAEGLRRLTARGYFELPQSSQDQLDSLISESGSIQDFVEECLLVGEQYRCSERMLWDCYQRWAMSNSHGVGKRRHILKSLEDALRGSGVHRSKSLKLDDGKFHRGLKGLGVASSSLSVNVSPFKVNSN